MCLTFHQELTDKFREEQPEIINLYKVIEKKSHDTFVSLYRRTPVVAGILKADKDIPQVENYDNRILTKTPTPIKDLKHGDQICGGAIHVCLTREQAEKRQEYEEEIIITCTAKKKDLIAVDACGEACFTEIFIPEYELK